MPITKDHDFACHHCQKSYQFFLPEQSTWVSFNKCVEDDVKQHNLPLTSRCQNCGNLNTVYYCISGHEEIVMGFGNSLLFDRNLRYISFSRLLALCPGYEYCSDARSVSQTFTLVALCLTNHCSSIMANLKKSVPFVCVLKHIFKKTIFLTGHRNYEYGPMN